jgi:hypothetical protein
MTVESIGQALGLRRIGQVWRGPCPLHGGKSFTVTERTGRVLVHCWGGCSQEELLGELRRRGLWPERERRTFTAIERKEYGRRVRSAEKEAEALLEWSGDLLAWMGLESVRAWFWVRVSRRLLTCGLAQDEDFNFWADVYESSESWGETVDRLRDHVKRAAWPILNRIRRGGRAA